MSEENDKIALEILLGNDINREIYLELQAIKSFTASEDSTIIVWEISGDSLFTLTGHLDIVNQAHLLFIDTKYYI